MAFIPRKITDVALVGADPRFKQQATFDDETHTLLSEINENLKLLLIAFEANNPNI